MKRRRLRALLFALAATCSGAGVFLAGGRATTVPVGTYTNAPELPRLRPDYTEVTIPPNIAPLNFIIGESGRRYHVTVRSRQGRAIEISSRKPEIRIPMKPWKDLLALNRGNPLLLDVYVQGKEGEWRRYQTIANRIADEDIDSHVIYRRMKPLYTFTRSVGVYQRNLENFNESLVLYAGSFGCVNCHTFPNNDPNKMVLGVRSRRYGSATLLYDEGKVSKIGTRFGYTAWHPNRRLAVFPEYRVRLFFHTARAGIRDVVDMDSRMCYYDFDKKKAGDIPPLADKNRLETYPAWSPDGRRLYFSSAPILWTDRHTVPPERYNEVRYDLRRVSYDEATGEWGEVETVLSAGETGLSILLPRVSPDGRFLLFCMCDYGVFAVYQESSDLYLMDLETGKYRKLRKANSDRAESWHCWSSNGRWIVFTSKRTSALFTKLYFSYIDEAGNDSKPFLLPQKDPRYYDSFLNLYNVPELVNGRLRASPRALLNAVRSPDKIEVDAVSGATPEAPAPGPSQRQE